MNWRVKGKRVLSGFKYDSEKGIVIGSYYTPGLDKSDMRYWEATLYRTKNAGRKFLCGAGGAMTRFAEFRGDLGGWGEKVIPMDDAEALEWSSHFLPVEVTGQEFADIIQDA